MSSKDTNGKKKQPVLYVRLPATLHRKVRKMAEAATLERGGKAVSLNDIVVRLIKDAPAPSKVA